MNFLALIIAVLLDRFSALGGRLRCEDIFQHWLAILEGLGVVGGFRPLLAVLGPLLALGLVLHLLSGLLFGLLWIAFASLLLLYSFGRSDLGELQERYRGQCRREDFEGAWLGVQAEFPALEEEVAADSGAAHALVQQTFLYESFQRWFGVLFYFLFLGPLGAIAYRLLQLLYAGERDAPVIHWLDWMPARALAATFVLTGNFSAGVEKLWEVLRKASLGAAQVLGSVANAAADNLEGEFSGQLASQQNEEQAALLRRSAVCWIAVLSLLVILA